MPKDTYLITAAQIAATTSTPKTHFLNANAQRENISLGDMAGLTGLGFHPLPAMRRPKNTFTTLKTNASMSCPARPRHT